VLHAVATKQKGDVQYVELDVIVAAGSVYISCNEWSREARRRERAGASKLSLYNEHGEGSGCVSDRPFPEALLSPPCLLLTFRRPETFTSTL
jgi:hypothetical protein